MGEQILLGVDGGNTKTDFLLCTSNGERLAYLRTGTCSHEALSGYKSAELALKAGLNQVCKAAGIMPEDIDSSVLGLAGADTAKQHAILTEVAESLLNGEVLVCNDSLLGIKAAIPDGIGICCINGTGASVSGIDSDGRTMQVGGIGGVSSDYAGGGFTAREVLRHVYSARYRDERPTALTDGVLDLFHAERDADLLELFHPEHLKIKNVEFALNRLLFTCAENGDKTAQEILFETAKILAGSTAGCIKNLRFDGTVTVVLAGSLWVKAGFVEMQNAYCADVRARVDHPCEFMTLEELPVLGAVLWAYERLTKKQPSIALRNRFAASTIV